MEEYKVFIDEIRKSTGIEAMIPEDEGLVSVKVDDKYNMNLQYLKDTGKILCFIEVAQLPADTPKTVYRDLLVGGLFGKDTGGGFFAIEPETETVVYNYYFDFEKARNDVEEFVHTLEKILQLCDIWSSRMIDMQSGGEQEEMKHSEAGRQEPEYRHFGPGANWA